MISDLLYHHARARTHTHAHTHSTRSQFLRSAWPPAACSRVAGNCARSPSAPDSRGGPGAHPRGGVTYPARGAARPGTAAAAKEKDPRTSPEKKNKKGGREGHFTSHKGKCCAPCTWRLRSCGFGGNARRPKELRLGWKVVGDSSQPAAPGSSSFPDAALTAPLACQTLRSPAGFHPDRAGLSCHMHLRNPSSCAKKSPRS